MINLNEKQIQDLKEKIEKSLQILQQYPSIYNKSELPPDTPFLEFLQKNKKNAQQLIIDNLQLLLDHWALHAHKLKPKYAHVLETFYEDLTKRVLAENDQFISIKFQFKDHPVAALTDHWIQILMLLLFAGILLLSMLIQALVTLSTAGLSIPLAIAGLLVITAFIRYLSIPADELLIEKYNDNCMDAGLLYNESIRMINKTIAMKKSLDEIDNASFKEAFMQYLQIAEKSPNIEKINHASKIVNLYSSKHSLAFIIDLTCKKSYQSDEAEMKVYFELFKHRYQNQSDSKNILDELVNCSLSPKDKIDFLKRYHAIEESYALSSCFLSSKSTRFKALLEEIKPNKSILTLNA